MSEGRKEFDAEATIERLFRYGDFEPSTNEIARALNLDIQAYRDLIVDQRRGSISITDEVAGMLAQTAARSIRSAGAYRNAIHALDELYRYAIFEYNRGSLRPGPIDRRNYQRLMRHCEARIEPFCGSKKSRPT